MLRAALGLLGFGQLATRAAAQSDTVNVKWLEGTPEYFTGATFGLPWPRGQHLANATTFTASSGSGDEVELQSWVTGYWPDGSLKWTGHAIGATDSPHSDYQVTASGPGNSTANRFKRQANNGTSGLQVTDSSDGIVVNTGKVTATFAKSGNVLVSSIEAAGKTVGENGRLILRSQSGTADDNDNGTPTNIDSFNFESKIYNATVSEQSLMRALVTVQGIHSATGNSTASHDDWLPFTVRFYMYANSEAVRVIHTIVYDGDASKDFMSGLGIRFDVPLAEEELYDRHIRIAGVDGGMLSEAVKGITGLRRDPGEEVRNAQINGTKLPDESTWATTVTSRLQWIPTWGDYRLSQLSPDGFNLKKRTKPGQSWIKIPGGTRAGGLAYLGGATVGGLAVGLRDFWKKYPTSLDVSNAATDQGSITMWLYSPQAEPMDLRPYHDGMGQDTYEEQLDALDITYEDYERAYNTPYGIARTNELYIYGFESTPSTDTLGMMTNHTNQPPVLTAADSEYIRDTQAIGSYWDVPESTSVSAQELETNMDFLLEYYMGQVEDRRWYGFWDHGDFMHTYDVDRHEWRYDVGGYAWDNSELSPDIFFWNQFLRTGRADVYRFAEAQVRHGGEVDCYHLGNFTGLGSRHNVQHFGDSAKQVRVATPVYRKTFFYVSGGDERTGDLVHEVLQAENAVVVVDASRKIRDPDEEYVADPAAVSLNFGTDWSGIGAAYLMEWERRGPRWEEARDKLYKTAETYPDIKNGFVTGNALYNTFTGAWSPPGTDPNNTGVVSVGHLAGVFGVFEFMDQLFDHMGSMLPTPYFDAWLDYCYYYNAPRAEQAAHYGEDFGSLNLKQGHSRFTAYVANKRGNATLAERAWQEFNAEDNAGFQPDEEWGTVDRISGSGALKPVREVSWISTNAMAIYGTAAIENLALIGAPGNGTVRRKRRG